MRLIILILFFLKVSICFAQIDTTIYFAADTDPQFKYGNGLCTADCLLQYNYDSIRVPKEYESEGNVYLQFVVEKNGQISNIKVLISLGELYDLEAIRLINSMPNWEPGILNGQNVRLYQVIPVKFMSLYLLSFYKLNEFPVKGSNKLLHESLSEIGSAYYQDKSLYFRTIITLSNNNRFTYTRQYLNDLYFVYGRYNLSDEKFLQFKVDTVQTNKYINDFNGKNKEWEYHFGKNLLQEKNILLLENMILLESDFSDIRTGKRSMWKTELFKQGLK